MNHTHIKRYTFYALLFLLGTPLWGAPSLQDVIPLISSTHKETSTKKQKNTQEIKKNLSTVALLGSHLETIKPKTRVFAKPHKNATLINYLPPKQLIKIIDKTPHFYAFKLFTGQKRYILKKEVKRHYLKQKTVQHIPFRSHFENEVATMGHLAQARANRYFPVSNKSLLKQVAKNIDTALIYWDQYCIDFFIVEKGWTLQNLL